MPFIKEEFSHAIFQMHPDKSPGPDGLNPAFYHKFLCVLGDDVFETGKTWLDECCFLTSLKDTKVVLIPKVDQPFSCVILDLSRYVI